MLLVAEKKLTRRRDHLTNLIRNLPWVRIEKEYFFKSKSGERTLIKLFDGLKHHLPQREVTFKVISRAPFKEIEKYRKRMGWEFDWVSSAGSDFNLDFEVSSGLDDESPGISVFYRDRNIVFQTYFTTGRGLEVLNSTYAILDYVPKGRDEKGLRFPMAWVKRHDDYK